MIEWVVRLGEQKATMEANLRRDFLDALSFVSGLIQIKQFEDDLMSLIERGVVCHGGLWSLVLQKHYGNLDTKIVITANNAGSDQAVRAGVKIFQTLDGENCLEGDLGTTSHFEIGIGGRIHSGSIAFGTGRDLVALNYLSTKNLPERVIVSRGGLDGNIIQSTQAEFENLFVSLEAMNARAADLTLVEFSRACGLVTDISDNTRIDTPRDFIYVLQSWFNSINMPL